MTATVTIGPSERDALHGLMLHRLFILGEQPLELAKVEGVSVEQLGEEFGEDLRLMEDLGWIFESDRKLIDLTMPPESLAKTIRRLRRDARRAPSEKRHENEPKETDEERWERFRRAVDACEEVLDLLDSRSREDAPPDAVECPLDPAGQKLKPYAPVSDGLVLAAVERSEWHEGADEIWVFVLAEHLGFEPARHTTRQLRPQLEYLRRAGSLTSTKKLGREYWSLTTAGREELNNSRQAEIVGELPESPQHREWRHARQKARGRMTEFRKLLYDALDDAGEVAASVDGACSGTWFELGERLRWAFWLLGSATYCMGEWIEPDDARPDIDQEPSSEPARRTTSAWRQKAIEARRGRR
jgi:hypothetical protein